MASRFKSARNFSVTWQQAGNLQTGTEMLNPCIDGYSRLPVSLECISNNKAPAVLACILKGVQTYGVPNRVRSYKGRENVLVVDYMIEKRGPARGSMIIGSSTHNQRIERSWRGV